MSNVKAISLWSKPHDPSPLSPLHILEPLEAQNGASGDTAGVDDMEAGVIELPWPDRVLSPNSRAHWAAKARATVKHKSWAHNATLAFRNGFDRTGDTIDVLITAYPLERRARDRDNQLASCKAYLDGIAYSLGIDDKHFNPRVQWGEPSLNGKIVVSLS